MEPIASPRNEPSKSLYYVLLAFVAIALVLPFWLTEFNPLVDYPFHLARAWALNLYQQDAFFQAQFVRVTDPMPNLAVDLLVPPLMWFLPPLIAGKLFLSLIILLFVWGCHELAKTSLGDVSWMAPLAAFFAYNSPLLWGFVNSSLSLSLFLLTFAFWLRFQTQWTVLRFLAVCMLSTATYIAHLSGFVFLGLAIACGFAIRWVNTRRLQWTAVTGFLVLVPGVLLQLYPWQNKVRLGTSVVWSTVAQKAISLGSVFIGYRYRIDLLAFIPLVIGLVIVVRCGKWKINPVLFTIGTLFLVAALAFPKQLTAGGGSAADARFVPPACALLLLSFAVSLKSKVARVGYCLALLGLGLRIAEISWTWRVQSLRCSRMVAILRIVEPHSRIYTLFQLPDDLGARKLELGNFHAASYSLILNRSVSSDFYAVQGVQPLYYRSESAARICDNPVVKLKDLGRDLEGFDYVFGCNLDPQHIAYLSGRASQIAARDTCTLWRFQPTVPTPMHTDATKP